MALSQHHTYRKRTGDFIESDMNRVHKVFEVTYDRFSWW